MRKIGALVFVGLLVTCGFLGFVSVFSENVKALSWATEIVDNSGGVGIDSSIALDVANRPHISYHDSMNNDLKYARWTGSAWFVETVDSLGWTGLDTSIALDSNNYAHISYYDNDNGNLKYARHSGVVWTIEVVDSAGLVGPDTSIALDSSDYPHISYKDGSNKDLKYAKWNGTGWEIEVVDSAGNVGEYSSIALDSNDYPHISYYDWGTNDVKYAKWNGTNWSTEFVDTTDWVGLTLSLALDGNDSPHISYNGYTNEDLMYANWDGSAWNITNVDSGGFVGWHNSIDVDTNGYPHIGYFDMGNDYLKYARWNGIKWEIEFAAQAGGVVTYTSLTLDTNDNPHMSWYYSGDNKLMYTKGSPTAPSAPLNLQAFAGDSEVTLTWEMPNSDGGRAITNYRIHRGMTSSGETFLVEIGNVLIHTDPGLVNGQTYYYEVSAVNGVGESTVSNEASAKPVGPPSAPQNPQAVAGDSQIALSWEVPSLDGGSQITNYRIYRGTAPGGEAFLVEIVDMLTHTDPGLANGQVYYYQISAVNALGEGNLSAEVSATPVTFPEPPKSLTVMSSGDSYVYLTWDVPLFDGGSPVTNYRVHRGTAPGGEAFLIQIGVVLYLNDTRGQCCW
jgi:fibronectin type 3 domain-containing protein